MGIVALLFQYSAYAGPPHTPFLPPPLKLHFLALEAFLLKAIIIQLQFLRSLKPQKVRNPNCNRKSSTKFSPFGFVAPFFVCVCVSVCVSIPPFFSIFLLREFALASYVLYTGRFKINGTIFSDFNQLQAQGWGYIGDAIFPFWPLLFECFLQFHISFVGNKHLS